jgi:Ca2+-binding RTX toxin-like protein
MAADPKWSSIFQGRADLLLLALALILPLLDLVLPEQAQIADLMRPIFIFAILGLGLNIVTGYTGLLNLGTAAFMATSIAVDPVVPGAVALVACGTAGNDLLLFTRGFGPNRFVVSIISLLPGGGLNITVGVFKPMTGGHELELSIGNVTFNLFVSSLGGPLNRFIAYGLAGNDDLQVVGSIGCTTELHGVGGNDGIGGGAGNDSLVGGDGDDLLVGGQGRDVMIGGYGRDRMIGNADDDILIAGHTSHDSNAAAIRSILAEWTSGRSYAERVANLMGTGSGASFAARANADVFLKTDGPAATVSDDLVQDILTGASGQDWFLFNLDGDGSNPQRDRATDLHASEFANDIDFINGV